MNIRPLLLFLLILKKNVIVISMVHAIVTFDLAPSLLLASERSERDTLRSVQLRIVDIYIYSTCNTCNFVLITRKEGGA